MPRPWYVNLHLLNYVSVAAVNSTLQIPTQHTEGAVDLLLASEKGDINEVTSLLLEDEINPNIFGNNKRTPLHCAAGYGHIAIVQSLLKVSWIILLHIPMIK